MELGRGQGAWALLALRAPACIPTSTRVLNWDSQSIWSKTAVANALTEGIPETASA